MVDFSQLDYPVTLSFEAWLLLQETEKQQLEELQRKKKIKVTKLNLFECLIERLD
jgi:hypothetical protein